LHAKGKCIRDTQDVINSRQDDDLAAGITMRKDLTNAVLGRIDEWIGRYALR
jgi:hypothetical protein